MSVSKLALAVLTIVWLSELAHAAKEKSAPPVQNEKQSFATEICGEISQRATENGIPETFFARLIWKESLFDPGAVSPKGAEGIAQFMPGTAKLRGLADPFDPKQALAASALYLAELRRAYGNLGLAAAAYNAGEDRARRWIAGTTGLPLETQNYVLSITGHGHDEWKAATEEFPVPAIGASGDFASQCASLVLRELSPQETPQAGRADWKRWGVIISAGFSETRALHAFRTIKGRHPLLKDEEPLVVRKTDLSRGRRKIVRVMIGRDSRAEAESLCEQLTSRGAACTVQKN
ncbi:MAG: lytic transglycosylase domain-containing protein [Rhizobiales bacterium]|nr:lytic transglycosylase domain-containing protein [Hyphomicrobiales bacterium]